MFSPLIIKLFALFGVSISNFVASAIVWSIVLVGVLVWYDHTIDEAEQRGRLACETKVKEITDAEKERVEKANDLVRAKDDQIRTIQQRKKDEIDKAVADAIKQTKENQLVCWDRDTIRNLNRVR